MKTRNKIGVLLLAITAGLCAEVCVTAQTVQKATTPKTGAPTPPKKKRASTMPSSPQLIVEDVSAAPQVVTLLHHLSGLKMFRLLLRSGDVQAVARLDEGFKIDGDVHTNVIAGLALDDGETIAAWLPEVDAEIAPPLAPAVPNITVEPPMAPGSGSVVAGISPAATPPFGFAARFEPPNVTVVGRNRQRFSARYVGLDGVTGLSVLKLDQKSVTGQRATIFAKDETLIEGQRVRLFGPEPVSETTSTASGPLYVRVGETAGLITRITRSPSGSLSRVQIRSPKVSAANIGGVAINDAGETLGIVDAVAGTEASILPANLIRGAARRVLARQASVPRPWLGVSGEPIGSFPSEQLLQNGWESAMAQTFLADPYGILLTSVAPGSPAWKASLRPGDVIMRVNDSEVRGGEHFSWLIQEAGPGGKLSFTVARPGKPTGESVEVKLSEAPSPLFGLRTPAVTQFKGAFSPAYQQKLFRYSFPYALLANGLETIALRRAVAARLGATGGLLVIDVQPATAAFKSGLRPGDVIEAINGQHLDATAKSINLINTPGASYSFSVVRNKQKLNFTFVVPGEKK